ncbi:MAG: putative metallohydrolase [Methanosaeta sp. PtaB.Bin039]|nr:MAG: putative metallohydrolase [Methanosaeta sp. PtaB.Bin039]OPY44557.1 MAG: putative metallohydrolase [Methanosaeta sp. PtaU1.Bin028]HOT06451.1 ArgE/DapE family deacylase [Methanotrichaceae archaeon]HQF16222.1 ArgE/DapE family deacylase [Methanotrichaceae archaeon]HQI90958.1 ArgE/DapE family deacylase [Methanotrichaceae archaeon]
MTEKTHQDIDEGHLLGILADLVSFRTQAPPGHNYHQAIDYLAETFRKMGFRTEKLLMPEDVFLARCDDPRLQGERVNLIATLDVGAKETLVIYTHIDVVPPGEGWSSDPFVLDVRDGRAFGRGVADSKGPVAAMIVALQRLLESSRPKYNLQVLLTTDEEVGGYSGLCYLTDSGLVRGDKMLCMDGFSDDVVIGSNGTITWEVVVQGRAAHSGYSFLGENAIEKAIPVLEGMMEYRKIVESKTSTVPASSSVRTLGLEGLVPRFNVTMIDAGIKENIIPDRCVIRGDRRVIPEESMEEAMEGLESTIKSLKDHLGIQLDLRILPGYPPMRMNQDHPWIEEVALAVGRVKGSPPSIAGSQGTLDQAYATEKTRIPAAVYGVGRQTESNHHGLDENVRVADLVSYVRFIEVLLSSEA